MIQADGGEIQAFFNRLRPVYPRLFNLAHAITGNCERAEYCLQSAMLDCWAAGDATASSHGFREGLRNAVIHAALKAARSPQGGAEFDWDGLTIEDDGIAARALAREPLENQRVLALRYGCGLSLRRIARLTDGSAAQVRDVLRRFEARVRRRLPDAQRAKCASQIGHAVRDALSHPNAHTPEIGGVFRTFQADAASVARPSRLPARILHAIFVVILAFICAVAFFLVAVLMQPASIESPAQTPAAEESAPPAD